MTLDVESRAILAAHNNADLYQAIFDAHDLAYERSAFAFIGLDQPPPYYSNLTTIAPDHVNQQHVALEEISRKFPQGFGFKDSFCRLAPKEAGLRLSGPNRKTFCQDRTPAAGTGLKARSN